MLFGWKRAYPVFSLSLTSILATLPTVSAADPNSIRGFDFDGKIQNLDIAPRPSLYSGDFADCLRGGSLFNFSNFDVAYYADSQTIFFRLDGASNIRQESLALHLSIVAYGETRFNKTYDPCRANMKSLCPLKADVPISTFAVVPLSTDDVAGLPQVTMSIPDFEGFSRIQIFANSTQTEIGCFQAAMANGKSLSQPEAIGSPLGVFVVAAMLSSFATAVYGLSVPHMRMHYSHSLSVMIVFETFQYIFFSGALSVSWPSVLPAWWSNFAWPSGMIASAKLVRSVSRFTGNIVDVSHVGDAGSVPIYNNGGLTQQIYGRQDDQQPSPMSALDSYQWSGRPSAPGMPIPGTWPGLPGTLSAARIPPAEAFTLIMIWFFVVVAIVILLITMFKLTLELAAKLKLLKTDGFDYFRGHYFGYLSSAVCRTGFIGFFALMTLAMYQFTLGGPAGPLAIAVIVFLLLLVGLGGIVAYACYSRLRHGRYSTAPDAIRFESVQLFGKVPFVSAIRDSERGEQETAEQRRLYASVPITRIVYADDDPTRPTVHQDVGYIQRFGWLAGRYPPKRWWYFAVYFGYQFVRACFIGGGARSPLAQVFGLFLFEILAFLVVAKFGAFESSRNTVVSVWLLSIAKVVTTGLSIAFIPEYNVSRIGATAIGLVIVVIQAFVAVVVLILAALSVMSTWMSLSRNREGFLEPLDDLRVRYFEHMEKHTDGLPNMPKPEETRSGPEARPESETRLEPEQPAPSGFSVRDVRRAPKIEDEDDVGDILQLQAGLGGDDQANRSKRGRADTAVSNSSRYSASSLPRAARVHRLSWSSREFANMQAEMMSRPENQRARSRSNSQRMPSGKTAAAAVAGVSLAESTEGGVTAARRPMTPTRESTEYYRDAMTTLDDDETRGGEEPRLDGLREQEPADSPKKSLSKESQVDGSKEHEEPQVDGARGQEEVTDSCLKSDNTLNKEESRVDEARESETTESSHEPQLDKTQGEATTAEEEDADRKD